MESHNREIINEYLMVRSVSKSTEKLYRQAVDSWDKLTQIPLEEIDKESLIKWYKTISEESKPATIIKYASNLRRVYEYLLIEGGISKRQASTDAREIFDVIPFSDLRQSDRKIHRLRDKIVTHEEFTKLLNGTSSACTKALISLTYESGCRKGEILGIKLKDITRRENHWSIIVSGKTGERTVPIVRSIPYLKAWIQQHPDRMNENQWLFVNNRSGEIKQLNPQGFNVTLRQLYKKLKIRRIHPHMLRHTRLTNLAEEGLGEYQMKSFAGWTAGSNMAAKYIHLTGTSHVNAVLETQGIDSGNGERLKPEPYLKLVECPNCGKDVDEDMIFCPYCQFILKDSIGISRQDELEKIKAELAELKRQVLEELKRT